jgi:hypothetical protein
MKAQRGSGGIVVMILNIGAVEMVVNDTPQPLYAPYLCREG